MWAMTKTKQFGINDIAVEFGSKRAFDAEQRDSSRRTAKIPIPESRDQEPTQEEWDQFASNPNSLHIARNIGDTALGTPNEVVFNDTSNPETNKVDPKSDAEVANDVYDAAVNGGNLLSKLPPRY